MKVLYFSLVAVIMAAACLASTISTGCVYIPECPSKNNENYTVHVPYKDDCHKFYKCNKKCGYLMDCPMIVNTTERLVFNPKLQVCDWPDSVPQGTCSTTILPTDTTPTITEPPPTTIEPPPTTIEPPPTTIEPPSILNCSIPKKCPAIGNTKIIHEKDCRKYYICRDGEKFPEMCQEGHIFNPYISTCDRPENTKCYRTDECPLFY